MKEENEYLVVYPGHNIAAYLYQRLLKKHCKAEIVTTPTKIYYGCSQSIKFNEREMEIVMAEIKEMNSSPKGVFKIIKKGRLEYYEKV